MLKFFGTGFSEKGFINGCIDQYYFDGLNKLCGSLFQRVQKIEDCDVIFIAYIYGGSNPFNHRLAEKALKLNKPIVVFDFIQGSTIFMGVRGIESYPNWKNRKDWELNNFLHSCLSNIKLYFKKELSVSEDLNTLPFIVRPIDFISSIKEYSKDTKKKFNSRVIDIYMVWSFSNISRALLHGELVKYTGTSGRWNLIGDFSYLFRDNNPRKIALLFIPWFKRIPTEKVLDYQNHAKISISLEGSAQKCHRHVESPCNSVMAMQKTNLVWKYPWIDEKNCIVLPVTGKNCIIDEVRAVQKLDNYLKQPDKLYSIYLNGLENARNYQIANYIPKYLSREILAVFK